MKFTTALAAIAASVLIPGGSVQATITRYAMELRVDRVEENAPCNDSLPGTVSFGCLSAGEVFRGAFGIDADFLTTNGVVTTAPIVDFRLEFGKAFYSTGPDNITLAGFRNGQGFADAPGFVIENGDVVDLYGGVFGFDDQPFIDMHPMYPRNRFSAADQAGTVAWGDLLLNRIPEPGSFALLGIALGALAVSVRRAPKG